MRTLLQPCPCEPLGNAVDRVPLDVVSASQLFIAGAVLQRTPNIANIRLRQFCVARAVAAGTTPLRVPISRVVLRGAKEEMIWPDAGRVVATMTNLYAIGDRAVGQFPGDAVSQVVLAPFVEGAVSTRRSIASPFPTAIAFLDIRPELITNAATRRDAHACRRAETPFCRRRSRERNSALFANVIRFCGAARLRAVASAVLRENERLLTDGTNGRGVIMSLHVEPPLFDVPGRGLRQQRRGHFTSIIPQPQLYVEAA